MKATHILLLAAAATAITFGCKKDKKSDDPSNPANGGSGDIKKEILTDLAGNIVYTTYNDMNTKANDMYNAIVAFNTSGSVTDLNTARQAWRDTRSAWEQSEGFLFGPVSVDNIDPRIDTWPVNYVSLDSIMVQTTNVLDANYVDNLEEALKGFHPIEYLLFGANGSKATTAFTAREKEFLIGLATNLKTLTAQVKASWDGNAAGNYSVKFTSAGAGSAEYPTVRAAYEEVINAMVGICDEVANGKIEEPYVAHDASLEESPYSQNSLADFANNIRSVQNVYLGKYIVNGTPVDGKGLEDLIKANNLSMDGQIKVKMSNAINALTNIPVPFGQAVTQSQYYPQVVSAQNAINDLKTYLEGTVLPFVQTLTN